MKSIKIMVEEHDNILILLSCMESACEKILVSNTIEIKDFRKMIDFGRNYADKRHHQKEEDILFKEMVEHLGPVAEKLVTHGMLVEHDLGRLFLSQLSTAVDVLEGNSNDTGAKLDVIGNAIGYRDLLKRHIDKENDVVYTYAERHLPQLVIDKIEKESKAYDSRPDVVEQNQYYLELLKELELKYR